MMLYEKCCLRGEPGDTRVAAALGYAIAHYENDLKGSDIGARRLIEECVASLNDHKGELTVYHRGDVPPLMQAAFRAGWERAAHEAAENVRFTRRSDGPMPF